MRDHKNEREFFFDKLSRYYLKYALTKHTPKHDESYEFDDKSVFSVTYDDVQNVIHVNYHSEDPVFGTMASSS